MKKLWQTPELTVLVRGQPEEAVLTACKNLNVVTGADSEQASCGTQVTPGGCTFCSGEAPS